MLGGENNNIINTLFASAGGAIIVYVITRIFSKTEDSASKEYVDTQNAKRDEKIERVEERLDAKIALKVEKTDFNIAIQQLTAKQDMIISLLLEQRQQSPQK